jgi:hypothetical protein
MKQGIKAFPLANAQILSIHHLQWIKGLFCFGQPRFRTCQKGTKCSKTWAAMIEKLKKARGRVCIRPGFVTSLTSFFLVPKGADDICRVCDASISGLNGAIWVPRFPLPAAQTHLREVDEGTHVADSDVGEMFLNFVLHSNLRALCGVDLTEHTDNIDELGQTI